MKRLTLAAIFAAVAFTMPVHADHFPVRDLRATVVTRPAEPPRPLSESEIRRLRDEPHRLFIELHRLLSESAQDDPQGWGLGGSELRRWLLRLYYPRRPRDPRTDSDRPLPRSIPDSEIRRLLSDARARSLHVDHRVTGLSVTFLPPASPPHPYVARPATCMLLAPVLFRATKGPIHEILLSEPDHPGAQPRQDLQIPPS